MLAAGQFVSSRLTIAAPSVSACNLAKAVAREMYFMPQSGGRDQRFGRQVLERRADAGGDRLRRFRLGVAHADDAEDHGLVAEAVEGG